jgi:hypothetical protein
MFYWLFVIFCFRLVWLLFVFFPCCLLCYHSCCLFACFFLGGGLLTDVSVIFDLFGCDPRVFCVPFVWAHRRAQGGTLAFDIFLSLTTDGHAPEAVAARCCWSDPVVAYCFRDLLFCFGARLMISAHSACWVRACVSNPISRNSGFRWGVGVCFGPYVPFNASTLFPLSLLWCVFSLSIPPPSIVLSRFRLLSLSLGPLLVGHWRLRLFYSAHGLVSLRVGFGFPSCLLAGLLVGHWRLMFGSITYLLYAFVLVSGLILCFLLH